MLPLAKPAQSTFEELLQDSPLDCQETAIEFQAFRRSRKVRSPIELMQLALIYSGIDKTLSDVAGNFSLLREWSSRASLWLMQLLKARVYACDLF